jgi:hypothetical protein
VKADAWETWDPPWAPHVRGRYTARVWDPASGMFEDQRVVADCAACGAHWEGHCASGNVRAHVDTFARVHTHRDALAAPRVEHPGSLRGAAVAARQGRK